MNSKISNEGEKEAATGRPQLIDALEDPLPDQKRDAEKGPQADIEDGAQDRLVSWEGEDDPNNPLNWGPTRRLLMTLIVSLCGLVSLMAASMMAPALTQIGEDLHLSPESTSLSLSIYLLAFAFGPLIIGPMSEMYGRKPVWFICHMYFIFWNALCPVKHSQMLMILGRFMSGIGGSVGIALPTPIMADIWRIEKRGTSIALCMFAPYLGAAVGPILGGFISQSVNWAWLFWVVSIFDAVLLLAALIVFHESYAPILLARKAKKLTLQSGEKHYTIYEKTSMTWAVKLQISLIRPFKLLFTRPIIQIIGLLVAYNFGAYTIALTTVAEVYTKRYHQSVSASGLHYIAISLGNTLSSQVTGFCMDKLWAYLKRRANGEHTPEFRVPVMIPGSIIMPVGLLIYGWSAQYTLHWVLTDFGTFFTTFGLMSSSQASMAYLIDEFAEHAASASAGMRFVSNLFGFIFPIFAPKLYQSLGYGWGNTLLGLLYIVLVVPVPLILWKRGAKIRFIGKQK